jgi:hypothetical protein
MLTYFRFGDYGICWDIFDYDDIPSGTSVLEYGSICYKRLLHLLLHQYFPKSQLVYRSKVADFL